MKALEFQGQLTADGTLKVPAEVAGQVHPHQSLRVLLLISESDEDREWPRFTADEFGKGYAKDEAPDVLGLFADEPDLADQVSADAMRMREARWARTPREQDTP